MQYKCKVCHDTGNKEKDMGGHLTCIACSAATDRVALEAFIEKLPAMGEQEHAWRIHQRALAMAPKQEAQEPVAWLVYAEDHNGMVPQFPAYATKLHATKCASMFGQTPTEVRPLYDHAATAATNGAMPELPKPFFYYESNEDGSVEWNEGCVSQDDVYTNAEYAKENGTHGGKVYSEAQMRAILAAAGPNAALIDEKPLVDITTAIMSQHGLIDHLSEVKTQAFCDDLCAALSGAKGN